MDHIAEFQILLQKLLSPDDDVRTQAEKAYEQIPLEQRASLLFATAKQTNVGSDQRQIGLVLLRRLLSNQWHELWPSLTPDVQSDFLNNILVSTQNEQDKGLQKKFCDLVAEVARNCLNDDGQQTWAEILQFLFDCGGSDNPILKETALCIIENIPGVFGLQFLEYVPVIKQLLLANLQYTSPINDKEVTLSVRVAAVKAATAILCDNEEDQTTLRKFTSLIMPMLEVCEQTILLDDNDSCLQCLAELASATPKIFRQNLDELCTMCLKTIANAELGDNFRHSALETIISLSESNPVMIRKQGSRFIPEIVKQCLALMVDVEDDPEWSVSDEQSDEDDDSNATAGETSLDRLACALGGKAVMPSCLELISPMLQDGNWKLRHAGLMALSTIGEGCHKQMEPILEQIVTTIIPFLVDPEPRVRYAACNAIGQMSTDFAPNMQKKFHVQIIPAVLAVLDDLSNSRVAAHAGAALVNFSEDAPNNVMVTYLDPVMQKLEWVLEQTFNQLVEKRKKLVLEQIVTTIASVADSAEKRFLPYYDRVMPCLKFILQNAVQKELRLLRGKTIECISLIGLAVGKEKFLPDAGEIMQLLLNSQLHIDEQDSDDPQISYMMSAWARVCTILGSDFVQYLPLVMPPVMKMASFKPEITVVENEEADCLEEEDKDWQFIRVGDQQRFGVKTSGLEDKATACQMIGCYARELKAGFCDYVEETTNLMVPLLKFYFHDGVRTAAAEAMPALLEAAKPKGAEFVAKVWQYILPNLLKAIEVDPENDVISELLFSVALCIECLGPNCLTEEDMVNITEALNKHMEKHFEKSAERDGLRQDEDYDEELEKELVDEHGEDAAVLSKISEVIHAAFKTHREAVLPFFEKLLPHLVMLMEPTRPYTELHWALCMFDDVIEFGGLSSVKYQPYFLPAMLRGLQHQEPEIRQAASYGFGIMGMYGGNAYAQSCAEAIPHLVKIIEATGSRWNEACLVATENAIAAVAKILKYNSSMIDVSAILPMFIQWLPIWEDEEECPHVYGYLCDLIESNNPIVIGENNVNLPHLVGIIVEAFRNNAFADAEKSAEVVARLRTILKHVQANEAALQACLVLLNAEQQQTLNEQLVAP